MTESARAALLEMLQAIINVTNGPSHTKVQAGWLMFRLNRPTLRLA